MFDLVFVCPYQSNGPELQRPLSISYQSIFLVTWLKACRTALWNPTLLKEEVCSNETAPDLRV